MRAVVARRATSWMKRSWSSWAPSATAAPTSGRGRRFVPAPVRHVRSIVAGPRSSPYKGRNGRTAGWLRSGRGWVAVPAGGQGGMTSTSRASRATAIRPRRRAGRDRVGSSARSTRARGPAAWCPARAGDHRTGGRGDLSTSSSGCGWQPSPSGRTSSRRSASGSRPSSTHSSWRMPRPSSRRSPCTSSWSTWRRRARASGRCEDASAPHATGSSTIPLRKPSRGCDEPAGAMRTSTPSSPDCGSRRSSPRTRPRPADARRSSPFGAVPCSSSGSTTPG